EEGTLPAFSFRGFFIEASSSPCRSQNDDASGKGRTPRARGEEGRGARARDSGGCAEEGRARGRGEEEGAVERTEARRTTVRRTAVRRTEEGFSCGQEETCGGQSRIRRPCQES